jgi:hypothetical protein
VLYNYTNETYILFTFRSVGVNDEIPAWAIDLIKQIERLNEKIPTHVDWVERNIKDHEMRIRAIERKIWIVAGAAGVISGAATIVWSALNG